MLQEQVSILVGYGSCTFALKRGVQLSGKHSTGTMLQEQVKIVCSPSLVNDQRSSTRRSLIVQRPHGQ